MDNQSLWTLIHTAWRAIVPTYEPLFEHFAAERGLGARGLGWLLAALTFEPESITPALLQVRAQYTAAGLFREELKTIAEGGCFLEAAPDEYLQNLRARAETLNLIEAGRAAMAEADPLPPADSQRIALLLCRIVEKSLETLTLLWRGEADSLDSVCEKLRRRGYPGSVYAGALAELRGRGFLEGPDPGPRLTESGKSFRDNIEQDTERYFFAAWSCLNDAEKDELADLATHLRDGLNAKTPGG